ncbi:MAG: exopolyphosphatase / guanosine-5-triphosphate,3-diphosphate pyrophosphatase [Solirubrobacteraceae bacterium]|jgi:exopolyphosphatase/guanosine-5'-triphosphate,3'-diphosphate pyrophosphatase|nr:exopolyphosphatase / guanosine-5-triphosphate,3-diphosphate pyrophosphatase [Solirubrobacteraceae bacterium]
MRVGVVDIGTNSTRLLVAEVADGRIRELERRSEVTRLGQGVDASGALAPEAQERVFAVLDAYRRELDEQAPDATTAVLTSAVRDASNGAEFTEAVRERYGLDARTIDGDTEAQLTFLGATATRTESDGPMVVIDIGGGSTEYVAGEGGRMTFHVSTQAGVVRQTERHLHSDPPRHEELEALAEDVRAVVRAEVPEDVRSGVRRAIAVAGTATSAAAIDLELEPYDPARVEGHVVYDGELELMLARLAELPLERRREVPGLHPDRAPTIVAGIVILLEALRAFGLEEVEVSEHDILWGAALSLAADAPA